MGQKHGLSVAAVLVTVVLAGCGTQTIVRTVESSGGIATSQPAQPAQASQTSSSPQQAKVGDTLTLQGQNGLSMAVTVDQVMDPLEVGQYDQPDTGQRYVGVQITLKNVGSVPYSDSPSNGATLLSNTNEQAQSQIVSGGPCGNDFPASANIAPGDTQQGCIPFELPVGQNPGTFQFTLNSGFGNQTGQWLLTSSRASSSASATTAPQSGQNGSGPGPANALRIHLQDLAVGRYQSAFALLTTSYQAQNPSWPSDRAAAKPEITIVSIGTPQYGSGSARVPVEFYARDRTATSGSDTQCRRFQGTASMVQEHGDWHYDPSGSSLIATVVPSTDPNCPAG